MTVLEECSTASQWHNVNTGQPRCRKAQNNSVPFDYKSTDFKNYMEDLSE